MFVLCFVCLITKFGDEDDVIKHNEATKIAVAEIDKKNYGDSV